MVKIIKAILLIAIVLIVSFFGSFKLVKKLNREFIRDTEFIKETKYLMYYCSPFFEYYLDNYTVPETLNDIASFGNGYIAEGETLSHLIDPFSKSEELLTYIPLFDFQKEKIIGYALISVGIDGRKNFSPDTLVSYDDLFKEDLFYNEILVENEYCNMLFIDTVFNLRQRILGTKDLLIECKNSIEFYKNSYRNPMTMDELFSSFRSGSLKNRVGYVFKIILEPGRYTQEQTFSTDGITYIQNDSLTVVFKPASYNSGINQINGIQSITGVLKQLDLSHGGAKFENCFFN